MEMDETIGAAATAAGGHGTPEQAAADQILRHVERTTLRQHPFRTRLIVEFVGTFFLVCVAAGAGVINHYVLVHHLGGSELVSRVAAVVAPGALVMALIYALGPLSGLHINPAVTLAFTLRGVFRASWALPYVAVQFAGACAGALFLQAMFSSVKYGANYPNGAPGCQWRACVMEVLCTLILVTVILHTATGYRSIGHNAAIAVGATIALLGLFSSPISGASMNPARTLAPQLVSGDLFGWWAYLVGPFVGAVLAVGFIRLVRGKPDPAETEAAIGGALPA
jgi:aquaporin Z